MALLGLILMAGNWDEPYSDDVEVFFGHTRRPDCQFSRDPFCVEDEWFPMSDSFFDDIEAFDTYAGDPAFLIDPVYVEKTSMYLELASDLLNEPSRSLQFNISSEIFCCEKHFWGLRTSVSPGHIACNNHRRLTCGYEDCPKFPRMPAQANGCGTAATVPSQPAPPTRTTGQDAITRIVRSAPSRRTLRLEEWTD